MGIIDVLLITCFYIFFSFPKTKGGGGENKKKKEWVWKSKHFLDWTIQHRRKNWDLVHFLGLCSPVLGVFLTSDGMGGKPPWFSRVYHGVQQLQLMDWKVGLLWGFIRLSTSWKRCYSLSETAGHGVRKERGNRGYFFPILEETEQLWHRKLILFLI